MRILFIGNSRIGDFVLASGLPAYLLDRYPDARLTIVCGRSCVPLTRGMPGVERVLVLEKKRHHRHWLELWRETVGIRWDMVVDLRDTAVSRLLRTRSVHRLKRVAGRLHRVEEIGRVLGLDPPPSPRLWLGPEERAAAAGLVPDGPPVLAVGPGATHPTKQWPPECFAEAVARLTAPDGPLPGAWVAALGAPDERESAMPLLRVVPAERRLDLMEGVPILTAAAVIERAALYLGNDNGQMHVAAAVGVPTLGLFGPTPAYHYRPWGRDCAYVQTDIPYEELAALHEDAYRARRGLMASLPVDKVCYAAGALLERVRGREAVGG